MLYLKDSAIKLFGQTIPLPLYTHPHSFSDDPSGQSSLRENELPRKQDDPLENRETSGKEITNDKQEDPTTTTTTSTTSGVNKRTKTCSPERETSAQKPPKNGGKGGEEEEETSISQEKTSKKPGKILPCPRCNSMDTKFCYYNNYNVNQPRHFCKKCQRYWTAGGTMRNVPVGAGRRKNKNSASHYRHIMLSESLRTAQFQTAINGIDNPSFGTASTVLNFGSDSPNCESQGLVISCGRETDTSSKKQEAVVGKNYQSFPCFPCPYPWNSTIAPANFSPSGFPVSICPWNMPPYPLGKHSNEEQLSTLRIEEDPGHGGDGKTSVWGANQSIFNRDGFLKGSYQSKNDDRIYRDGKSLVLQANPAALSRSLNFHESS